MKFPTWRWKRDEIAKHYKVSELLSKFTVGPKTFYEEGLAFGVYSTQITRLIRLNINVKMNLQEIVVKEMKELDSFPEKQSLIMGIFTSGVL